MSNYFYILVIFYWIFGRWNDAMLFLHSENLFVKCIFDYMAEFIFGLQIMMYPKSVYRRPKSTLKTLSIDSVQNTTYLGLRKNNRSELLKKMK